MKVEVVLARARFILSQPLFLIISRDSIVPELKCHANPSPVAPAGAPIVRVAPLKLRPKLPADFIVISFLSGNTERRAYFKGRFTPTRMEC